jgi:hypothetical protein
MIDAIYTRISRLDGDSGSEHPVPSEKPVAEQATTI